MTKEEVLNRIQGLWSGTTPGKDGWDALVGVYRDFHGTGESVVDDTIFDPKKSRAHRDLMLRWEAQPGVGKKDEVYLKKVSEGDQETMATILYAEGVNHVDFAYEVYEKYYMDSMEVNDSDLSSTVETLKEDLPKADETELTDEVNTLARDAYGDGVESQIQEYAKSKFQELADEELTELQESYEEVEAAAIEDLVQPLAADKLVTAYEESGDQVHMALKLTKDQAQQILSYVHKYFNPA